MNSWIRNADGNLRIIQQEIMSLVQENNLLRDKISLLEAKIQILEAERLVYESMAKQSGSTTNSVPSGISGPIQPGSVG